ncbi:hypothetical protein [Streptomyces coelicoflavus]|uniref:hypothetical protein n=1 Tax=Streptomyces coelicoflavus TaxID=285562 RepID=UPI0036CCE5EF
MVSRMFRLVTEVDKERRNLLRTRLRETNTAASSVLRSLRGDLGLPGPGSYTKHGYDVLCVIPDHPPGAREYTLVEQWG